MLVVSPGKSAVATVRVPSPWVPGMSDDRANEQTGSDRVAEIRRVIEVAVSATCPRSLRHVREDILQGAMVRIVRTAPLDDDRWAKRSYLWKVAYSAILDELRAARRREAEQGGATDLDATSPSPTPGPEARARSAEIASAIRDCLQTLVDSRKRVVTLHLLGYGLGEIAGVLRAERKQIDNLLYRGMKNLRDCLRAKAVFP